MTVAVKYYSIEDTENCFAGICGSKSGGVESITIEFYPNTGVQQTEQYKNLEIAINELLELAKTKVI